MRLNFPRSCIGGRILPLCRWQKNDRKQIACVQMSMFKDLLSPLFKSSSIDIIMGALLLWNDDAGLSSSTPFRILCRWSPPSQARLSLSCSFLMANSFVPTVLPAGCPVYEDAHVIRMSFLAGSASLFLIPRPSQNIKNSHNWLASFLCVVLSTTASCVCLILSIRLDGNLRSSWGWFLCRDGMHVV